MGRFTFKEENELKEEVEIVKSEKRVRVVGGVKGLTFDKNTHTYLLDGVILLSGTQLVKKYVRPFERYYLSAMVAKKNERLNKKLKTDVEVRKFWDAKGERHSSLGTSCHAFCQMYMMDNTNLKPIHIIEENAIKLLDKLKDNFDILNLEVNRGNRKYKIGYSIDIELQHKKTGDIYLGDYKFSEAFTNEQYKEVKGALPNYLLYPFNNLGLRDSTFDKAKIQLNIYKRLYELDTNLKVKGMLLFHIDGLSNRSWYGDIGFKIYQVPELNKEVNIILKPHENIEYDLLKEV